MQRPVAAGKLHLAEDGLKIKRIRPKGPHVYRRVGRRIQVDSHTCLGRDNPLCNQGCTKLRNEINNREESNKYCM
jgi:hypothetical protein